MDIFETLCHEILIALGGFDGTESKRLKTIIYLSILSLLQIAKLLSRRYFFYYLLAQIIERVLKENDVVEIIKPILRKINNN